MKFPFSQETAPHYTTLPSTSSDDDKPPMSPRSPHRISLLTIFLTTTSLLTALLCGFTLGRLPSISQTPPTSTSPSNFNSNEVLLPPSGDHLETWIYNRTFSQAPTEETEKAWRDIFPSMSLLFRNRVVECDDLRRYRRKRIHPPSHSSTKHQRDCCFP